MARMTASLPGHSRFERNMKYVHTTWMLCGALVALFSLALYAESGSGWLLVLAMPVALLMVGYGLWLLVGHHQTLARRRLAWATGVPTSGRVFAKAPSSLGGFSYWRVGVQTRVGGRTISFEDRFVYPHVAKKLTTGDIVEFRYNPEDPGIFAFDMRL